MNEKIKPHKCKIFEVNKLPQQWYNYLFGGIYSDDDIQWWEVDDSFDDSYQFRTMKDVKTNEFDKWILDNMDVEAGDIILFARDEWFYEDAQGDPI